MKIPAAIIFGMLITHIGIVAQPPTEKGDAVLTTSYRLQIDSLQNVVATSAQDTNLVNQLCLISVNYDLMGSDSAYLFAQRAIDLAQKLKEPLFIVRAMSRLGHVCYKDKRYKESTQLWQKALSIAAANYLYEEELYRLRAPLNNNYFLEGNYVAAMEISTGGLATADKVGDKERSAHFSNVLGYIHMKLGNFEESQRYYFIYLGLAKEIKNNVLEAHALYNLADLAVSEKKTLEAIRYLNDALAIYRGQFLYGLDPREREAYVYNKLAEAYKQAADYSSARQYILSSLSLAANASVNLYDIASYHINAGDIYNRRLQPDSSLLFLRQGASIAIMIRHREEMRDAYEQMALSFALNKRYDSAFFYYVSFTRLKDSIQNENSEKKFLQREANLHIEQQRRIQQAELKQQQLWRNIIICIALLTIFLLIMLYNRYRIRQKMHYQQQLNKQQNEMFNLAVLVQEKERKRIAEDIHDSLGSILSAAKLKLSSLKDDEVQLTEMQLEKYYASLNLLDEASAELRSISHNIMPATLSRLGLVAALKNLVDRITSRAGLQLRFEAHGFEHRLQETVEINIYCIVLELINNIVKHAGACKATIQVIQYPDYINVTVEDDGIGFDYKRITELSKGMGLGNILSRLGYLKGTIDIDSCPGKGTTVLIDIPYRKQS